MADSSRDAFLQAVNRALHEGNRPGAGADLPARGHAGYQGAGPDALARFRDELTASGGHPYLAADAGAAAAQLVELVQGRTPRQVLLGRGSFIDTLGLTDRLRALGIDVLMPQGVTAANCKEPFFAADVGITGVDYLIAETGSVALLARPEEPRSFSLLPPVHIAIAHHSQILPDLFDLFGRLATSKSDVSGRPKMSSCLSLITGPSKTGDIELRLVTGVHGPGELHVIVVAS
jgi:L-lactate dehydrogenase complex protein LldG